MCATNLWQNKYRLDCFVYITGSTEIDYGKHAPTFDLLEFLDILQGPDCNDKRTPNLVNFCNKSRGDSDFSDMFSKIQDLPYFKSTKIGWLIL